MVKRVIAAVDDFQRLHAWLGFPYAVVKKFGDDEAGKHAALIAYYGFFSLFPLMLVFVTVLGFFLGKSSHFSQQVVHSVLARFPIIGPQIRDNVGALKGSGLALGVGIAGSLWGGMGVVRAAQNAMDAVWDVPRKDRPNFVKSRLRAILLLLVLGAGVILTTVLAGVATAGTGHSFLTKILVLALSTVVNVALFLAAFKLLTVAKVSLGQLVPGAVTAAIAWEILQAVGGYYLGHTLKGASTTYGFFALVIGLLSWIYIQAQITLLAAEVNTVRAYRLWPRGLQADRLTEADETVLRGLAKVEERRPDEDVDVSFQNRETRQAS
jgi:YihY family inner membrane protein